MSDALIQQLRTQYESIAERLDGVDTVADREAIKRDIIGLFKTVDQAINDLAALKEEIRVLVDRYKQLAEQHSGEPTPQFAAEALREQFDDVGFVVDDEYGDGHAAPPWTFCAVSPLCRRGSVMVNSVYWPSFESTVNRPLCCCTTMS